MTTQQTVGHTPAQAHQMPYMSGRIPVIGHLGSMAKNPLDFLLSAAKECGDIAKLRLLANVYLVNDPDIVDYVMRGNHMNFRKPKHINRLMRLIGNGLLVSEGEYWKKQRRIVQPAFHKRRLQAFATIMAEETEETLRLWRTYADGTVVDMTEDMSALALRVVGRAMCGMDLTGQENGIGEALTVCLRIIHEWNTSLIFPAEWMPTPKNRTFNKAKKVLNDAVDRIIAGRRKQNTVHDDLLHMLLEVRDEDTGEAMMDVQLRDEVMTMLLAGHETTATALSWTLALLAEYPETLARAQEAVKPFVGITPTLADMPRLTLIRSIILETMRLYPPVWLFARSPVRADMLGTEPVGPKDVIFISPFVLHRNPRIWQDPERFDIDRWTGTAMKTCSRGYAPFAGGPRKCAGDEFAMMEMTIVLTKIMNEWRFEPVLAGMPKTDPALTLRQAGGLPMKLFRI